MKAVVIVLLLAVALQAAQGNLIMLTIGIILSWSYIFLSYLPTTIIITEREVTWCGYLPLAGYPVGALITSLLLNGIGRKLYVLTQAPMALITFIIIIFAKHFYLIGLARFLMGVTEGALKTALPIYYGEIVDPMIRGAAAGSIVYSQILGMLLIVIIESNSVISKTNILYAIVLLVTGSFLLVFAADSPYFLIKKKDLLGARQAIMRLRKSEDIHCELTKITEAVEPPEASFLDILRVKSYRRGICIYTIISVTTNVVGTMGNINIYGIISMLVGIMMIDSFGRRSILIASCLGCTLITAIQALYDTFQYCNVNFLKYILWIPQATNILLGLFYSFGISFGTIVLLSEIFPPAIKVKACGIANAFHILLSIVASLLYKEIYSISGAYLPMVIFSLLSAFGMFLICKFLPEMKGKTLEEIQSDIFGR